MTLELKIMSVVDNFKIIGLPSGKNQIYYNSRVVVNCKSPLLRLYIES